MPLISLIVDIARLSTQLYVKSGQIETFTFSTYLLICLEASDVKMLTHKTHTIDHVARFLDLFFFLRSFAFFHALRHFQCTNFLVRRPIRFDVFLFFDHNNSYRDLAKSHTKSQPFTKKKKKMKNYCTRKSFSFMLFCCYCTNEAHKRIIAYKPNRAESSLNEKKDKEKKCTIKCHVSCAPNMHARS